MLEKTQNSRRKEYFSDRLNAKCSYCGKFFTDEITMKKHQREQHRFCHLCQQFYDESIVAHRRSFCPEYRIKCDGCSGKIPRKNIQ